LLSLGYDLFAGAVAGAVAVAGAGAVAGAIAVAGAGAVAGAVAVSHTPMVNPVIEFISVHGQAPFQCICELYHW